MDVFSHKISIARMKQVTMAIIFAVQSVELGDTICCKYPRRRIMDQMHTRGLQIYGSELLRYMKPDIQIASSRGCSRYDGDAVQK